MTIGIDSNPNFASEVELPSTPSLSTFEFDVATVIMRRSGLFGINSTWEINRSRSQAELLSEDLGGSVILEMVSIPGGKFLMGSSNSEPERWPREGPQNAVTVKPFFMGKYPVTQAQWEVVAALTQVKRPLDPNPSSFKGANRPVENVSWHDAVEFCSRLSKKTGREYRLPSEAEWEYACRAGTTTPFYFGKTITSDLANYDGDRIYGTGPQGKFREQTTPVGSFQVANAFGLYDMHGNVEEWCADRWHENYEGAPSDGSAWLSHIENQSRVLRGGSWLLVPSYCRSAYRSVNGSDVRNPDSGFRVVCQTGSWLKQG
ncbi:MAG: formylglycine-generating enzyme family protein [Xenococcaceae cyanobacterium]